MEKTCTNRVSTQLVYARERGLIPWAWIVDETREAERTPAWEDPGVFVEVVKRSYRRDRWALQPHRVEVWSEKGTVRGTLAPVLDGYGVTFRVMHGYGSATAIYEIARESCEDTRPWTVFYVGDWDPSGLYMSEIDLPRRLVRYGQHGMRWLRVALTPPQIEQNELPGFAVETKKQDTRYGWFRATYGRRCWELDALDPVTLRADVEHVIQAHIDWDAWNRCGLAEEAEKESLATILDRWKPSMAGQDTK